MHSNKRAEVERRALTVASIPEGLVVGMPKIGQIFVAAQ